MGDLVEVNGNIYADSNLNATANCRLKERQLAFVLEVIEKPNTQYRVFVGGIFGWVNAAQVFTY